MHNAIYLMRALQQQQQKICRIYYIVAIDVVEENLISNLIIWIEAYYILWSFCVVFFLYHKSLL